MTDDLAALPHLQDLFDRLRAGYHVCAEDGPPYLALREHLPDYQRLFAALGFELIEHDRGFCYFRASGELGKEASSHAVFFFVLVEAWSETGRDLQQTVFDPAGHRASEFPHFERESWRACMSEAGVRSQDDLTDLLRRLDRLGFAERTDDDRVRFRAPAWRFLDLCREVLEEEEERAASSAPEDGEGSA